MKKIIVFFCIFSGICSVYSQNYDLVVKTNGDSMACHIDSITDTQIYLEMRYKGNWVHTFMNKNEIIEYKYDAIDKMKVYFEPGNSKIHPRKFFTGNHHAHMYSFGPSALSLAKGDRYYTTYYGLIHDIQFGVTDRFTLRTGTDIIFAPIYLLPTYTFPVNDKSAFAIGDLFLAFIGEFYGNLTYGSYTYGTKENNISLGTGIWSPNIIDFSTNKSAAFSLSGQHKLSENVYFASENYAFKLYSSHVANNKIYGREEEYHAFDDIFFGFSGIKVINRKNGLKSWQFSLLYVLMREGEAPEKFHTPPWEGVEEGKITFVPVPIIGYSRKFGKKY